jgi:DNA-binding SARP family transcriptional activator
VRIYLTGRLGLEEGDAFVDEAALPARQGRLAFAYLVMERRRPVPRRELAAAIWDDDPPEAWDAALSALLSRLRRLFRGAGLSADVETLSGAVGLRLPASTWVDVEAERSAIDEAEGALRFGDARTALSGAAVAWSIADRGFLHGDDLPWVVLERNHLRAETTAWGLHGRAPLRTTLRRNRAFPGVGVRARDAVAHSDGQPGRSPARV